LSNTV